MKKIIALALMILGMTCYTKLFAQKPAVVGTNEPGWHHIGQLVASFKSQNESLSVLGADEFSALKIKVTDGPLHIERLQVFYESGDMEEIDVREHFKTGTETRVIKLSHPDRDIKKVAFTYHSNPNAKGEKAEVDVYGLKTNQPAGKDSYRDERDEVKEEAKEAKEELNEESREAKEELKEESREARDEVNEEAEKAEDDAQSVGDKIEEGAKDAAAAITDQKLKDKVGPGGETAYVDEHGKYYYISNAGEKVFITRAQLRNKKVDDK
jgi:hypothetical protein